MGRRGRHAFLDHWHRCHIEPADGDGLHWILTDYPGPFDARRGVPHHSPRRHQPRRARPGGPAAAPSSTPAPTPTTCHSTSRSALACAASTSDCLLAASPSGSIRTSTMVESMSAQDASGNALTCSGTVVWPNLHEIYREPPCHVRHGGGPGCESRRAVPTNPGSWGSREPCCRFAGPLLSSEASACGRAS